MPYKKNKKYTKKEESFIQYIKIECKKHGFKVELRNVKYVKVSPTVRCSGYFDDSNKKLVCSMNKPDALEILTHEFAHFTQWKDQCKVWLNLEDSIDKIDSWLSGEDNENIRQHIKRARDLELDNEKRSVKLIKKFGLNIDIDTYIKRANAYLIFYNHMLTVRRWCKPTNMPYENKRVVEVMPNNFKLNYDKIPKKIMRVYQDQNI